ncbi:OmpA family protein [Chromatium okenii]|nr:OmpA family protein [Chromatium okenii]
MEAIYRFSGGVPRMINLVSSRLLLHSFIEEAHVVTLADVEFVLGELRQEELTPQQFVADNEAPAEPSASELAAAKVDWAQIDCGLSAAMLPPVKTAPAPFVSTPPPPAARRDDSPPPPKNPFHDEAPHWEAPPAAPARVATNNAPSESLASAQLLLAKHWRLALLFSLILFGAGAALYLRQFVAWRPLLDHAQQWISSSTTTLLTYLDAPPAPAFTPVIPETPPPVITPAPAPPLQTAPPAPVVLLPPAPEETNAESTRTIGTIDPVAPAIAAPPAFASTTETDLSAAEPSAAPPPPLTVSVSFARNSTIVEKQFFAPLAEVVARLTQFPTARGTITGYSDRYGNAAYNLELSRRRANAVADYLVAQGITRARLDVSGLGPRDQPDTSADTTGRVVELTVNAPTL